MKLYACIISTDAKREILLSIAEQFSYSIELLEDGILFDVSGLQNLVGDAKKISQKILAEMKKSAVSGSIAVTDTLDAAELLARGGDDVSSNPRSEIRNPQPEDFAQVPLQNLLIDDDTLNVFSDLGIKSIRDLQQVPTDELITRYGQQFKKIIDVIEQKGSRLLTPNVKENKVSWSYNLDFPVDDFEQLVFILNHGLDKLLTETDRYGFSTEQLDLSFKLQNKTQRVYEIKTSFPTLEKTFWLKLINLRISLDPPESEIVAINVTANFTPPRPAQRGLYAVSRPDPERLLLTVNKLKNLVGEENVGVPVILDQRIEKAFALDAEAVPEGKEVSSNAERVTRNAESLSSESVFSQTAKNDSEQDFAFRVTRSALEQIPNPVIAFSYFNPPIPADVLVRDKKLIFIRTQYFNGHVTRYSGVWKANSKWWDKSWKAQEWDVEIEDQGVYRLCKVGKDWFLAGEYD
jgi:protein ImuB